MAIVPKFICVTILDMVARLINGRMDRWVDHQVKDLSCIHGILIQPPWILTISPYLLFYKCVFLCEDYVSVQTIYSLNQGKPNLYIYDCNSKYVYLSFSLYVCLSVCLSVFEPSDCLFFVCLVVCLQIFSFFPLSSSYFYTVQYRRVQYSTVIYL